MQYLKFEQTSPTYNRCVSADPASIFTVSSSGKLFNLNEQKYVSASRWKLNLQSIV